ncbi:MAG TPA: CHAT domain-containing protein [Longimicrobium sp.]|nr:CHAT domain-containing protein [Longimicrobium sp.]
MSDRSAVAGEALVAYWRGAPVLPMRDREHCRRLEEHLGPGTRDALARAALDDEPGCAERAASALRTAATGDPVVSDLVAKLAPGVPTGGGGQSVNVTGNGNRVISAGRDVVVPTSLDWFGPSVAAPVKEEPLPILFAAAEPTELARLRLGDEERDVRNALRQSRLGGRIILETRPGVRIHDFTYEVLEMRPWVIHFSGHGTGAGEICFQDELGNAQQVSPDGLADFLAAAGETVQCVVLNACYSEPQARAIAAYIPWVVGMRQEIHDKAAIAFSVGFYQALGAGKSFAEAFKVARSMIRMHKLPGHLTPVLIPSAG